MKLHAQTQALILRTHPLTRSAPLYPISGFGIFGVDDVIGLAIKIVLFVSKIIRFIRDLIKGSIVTALLAVIDIILPAFASVVNLNALGLGWISRVIQGLSQALETVVGGLLGVVKQVFALPGISEITRLDVFDSLSAVATTQNVIGVLSIAGVPTPMSPQDLLKAAADPAINNAIDSVLEQTPLGKTILDLEDAAEIATGSIPSNLTQAALREQLTEMAPQNFQPSQLREQVSERIGETKEQLAAREAQAREALESSQSQLSKERTSLEDRLQAGKEKLEARLQDALAYAMSLLAPGQKLEDLDPMTQGMIEEALRKEYPDTDLSHLLAYKKRKSKKPTIVLASSGVLSLLMIASALRGRSDV